MLQPRGDDAAGQVEVAHLAVLVGVQGYVASLLLLLPVPLGLFATTRVADQAQDEAAGRIPLLLSRPVGRIDWATQHVAVIAAACLGMAVLTGSAAWLGTRAVGSELTYSEAIAGALNVVVVAWLSLGAAVLALGWAPRAVALIGALPVVSGFILWVLADTLNWPDWVGLLSPFTHVARVPAEAANWHAQVGMLAVVTVLLAIGLVGFARRDLRG